ncbi:MAG: tRNA (adenosine(37)-N6)-threonylcarbamoyltransferase complex dimerization subunit type 1 TsaB [Gemmatimonadetes bacterium]|nr:tRNA (adenosine(37)-N6)-threonylcarbamoyltransferase complex dimerization subunit type 1 TsaB [Gemmatimonadota bacterium]
MWLALDASTYVGSVAVLDGANVVASGQVAMRGATEERLLPEVVRVVAVAGGWDCLTAVWVGGGPGSFTSLRIAASIAKGIATARNLPLWSGSSLALAASDPALGDGTFVIALDALRGEVYVQEFARRSGAPVAVGPWRRISADSAKSLDGEEGVRLVSLSEPNGRPHAAHLPGLLLGGLAARVDLASWEPEYGRLAEAQVVWEARHGRSLPAGPG